MKFLLAALIVALGLTPAFAQMRPITTHTLNVGASSSMMATAITTGVSVARIIATSDIHFVVGVSANISANATDGTSVYLPANTVELLAVRTGEYIAVIQDSATGVVYITEMTK